MKAPFPYFGGKSSIAASVWKRFGAVENYVEPFFGSGAVLLNRPGWPADTRWIETVNDADGLLSNFWRALSRDPEAVARYADWPVNECDLHARHLWLVGECERITTRLEGSPDWFDAKAAGYWVWGISCWIGSGWCAGNGPWIVRDGEMIDSRETGTNGRGVNRKLPHLGGKERDLGRGVNATAARADLLAYFEKLAARLRDVRVCCGDWSRVCGPSVTFKHGLTAVFLDPPYSDMAKRADGLYAKDCLSVAHDVREWAIANGDNPLLRIALCGYEGEHEMPDSWETVEWKGKGGYDGQSSDASRIGVNRAKERIWFSPHCVRETLPLFASAASLS